jgi:hypothetical protein
MRRSILAVLLLVAALPGVARSEPVSKVRAGYGEADASWRVGAGSGQYAAKDPNLAHLATGGEVDPFNHGWTQRHSYGVQSRLSIRTIVVEGSNGKRAAFVKMDNYLAADALSRRAAQILDAAGTSGIHYSDIMQMATHNHSSPFYFSPSWGVWLFQDVFDIRAFEYEARQMALSIERAAADLRPARMGATKVKQTIYKGNIAGATIGDDGTPAGYPDQLAGSPVVDKRADTDMTIVRFDDVTTNEPIAVLVNHGQHPESNDDYALITADYLAPAQRMLERDIGAKMVWSQGDVGSAEGPYFRGNNEVLPDGVIRAWAHVGHAQTERGARYLANAIEQAYAEIGAGGGLVPYSTDFPVMAGNAWVPGPVSHPYPSVSNCRTEPTVEGNPGMVITGLPDCDRPLGDSNDDASQLWQQLKGLGAPLPEHYDAPAFGSVEENLRLHLQAFRLGEVVFASCACEAQMDLILNFESRADSEQGNIYDGFEYPCTPNPDTTWTCQSGSNLTQPVTISNDKHARMMAEVHNDAKGWEDTANALSANSEPLDPSKIKGNFTKEELPANLGYTLPVGVGHAGDYNGYVVSYREYMIRDHYRKALTAYGPHTADYMVTRMVRLAGSLKGGPAVAPEPLDALAQADEVRETAFMTALGQLSSAAYDAWLAALPNDVGPAAAVVQPSNITRFQAATFTWRGGSNATDNPVASVQRLVDGEWMPFADQSGEVQTMVHFPTGVQGVLNTWTGKQEWHWTANFEAFDAFPRAVIPGGQTPAGTYRFVVDGQIRSGSADHAYHLASAPFSVASWGGLTPSDPQRTSSQLSFAADATYPRTYSSQFAYIHDDGNLTLCKTCSFRPWAKTGNVTGITVHIVRGVTEFDVVATLSAGRWVVPIQSGDVLTIQPGGIVDEFGETNAAVIALP